MASQWSTATQYGSIQSNNTVQQRATPAEWTPAASASVAERIEGNVFSRLSMQRPSGTPCDGAARAAGLLAQFADHLPMKKESKLPSSAHNGPRAAGPAAAASATLLLGIGSHLAAHHAPHA